MAGGNRVLVKIIRKRGGGSGRLGWAARRGGEGTTQYVAHRPDREKVETFCPFKRGEASRQRYNKSKRGSRLKMQIAARWRERRGPDYLGSCVTSENGRKPLPRADIEKMSPQNEWKGNLRGLHLSLLG